ncbi:MAG: cation diffusion facilitator family transporter [Defluviitaleaceae bacterium]|nr:cation diffusion facilitator family transporter [Defluviitaleaceae bacterium]
MEREKLSKRVVGIGIVLNVFIFVIKVFIGFVLGSIAIIADGVNNLIDAFSNFLVALGIRISGKPADTEHPFGHGRGEYLTALIVACVMIFFGIEFLRASIDEIINPTPVGFSFWLIGILLATALSKVWLYIFYKKSGKKLNSKPISTLAVDNINDAITTFLATGSIVFAYFTNIMIDGYVGVAVSLIILRSGYKVAKDTISTLLGEGVDKEQADKIQALIESDENILGTHDLIVHNYGPTSSMATLHVEMSNTITLDQSHKIIDELERRVKKELGIQLVLHIDPISVGDGRLNDIKKVTLSYISQIDKSLDAHDFKIIDADNHTDIVFELVFPHGFDKEKENLVIVSLEAIIKSLNESYRPIIEPEYRFIKE